jgi:mannose-6-phosphate isomerase-like protein (cupin superfamily)
VGIREDPQQEGTPGARGRSEGIAVVSPAESELPVHFDPSETYVHLTSGGSAEQLAGGERFWSMPESALERFGDGWLVTEFESSADWSNWEMHPEGDEFVYLLSGAAVMLLELPDGVQEVSLRGRAAVVVPRGTWHTARISEPTRMLFVTMGRGTRHRAA